MGIIFSNSPTNSQLIRREREEDVFEDVVQLSIVQQGHQVNVFPHLMELVFPKSFFKTNLEVLGVSRPL